MKNTMKNIKNAVVKFFIYNFLMILYILEVVCYSIAIFASIRILLYLLLY